MDKAVLFLLLWFAGSPAATEEAAGSGVLVARGVLARAGDAGNTWTLTPDGSLKYRGETIVGVTFVTRTGEEARAYEPYRDKEIELTGEVRSVLRGRAELSRVHTIAMVPSPLPYLSGAVPGGAQVPTPPAADRIPYRHAYYLFLAGNPQSCEACYVPLLVVQDSLEQAAKKSSVTLGVLILTYERDSIWAFQGATAIDPSAIETAPRMIRAIGKSYRYQEISPSEVLKLLQAPNGTIPISRPYQPGRSVPGASMSELVSDFRAVAGTGPPASPTSAAN